jgi:hypothetical protein
LVQVADHVPKPTQNGDLHVGETFDAIMHVTLPRHPDPVNAVQELEDPPQGRRRGRLVDLVRHGLMVCGSWLAQSALRHGVHQQRGGHHHQQACNPTGLFDKQRRDKKQRVFEPPKAPLNPRLAFVGRDSRGGAQLASTAIGPQHNTGLDVLEILNHRIGWPDVGLD